MSRRTHGLVALLATAALVAVLAWWWAGTRTTDETSASGPSTPASTADSGAVTGSASIPTPAPPTASVTPDPSATPSVLPGSTLTPCRRSGKPKTLTVVTFNIHSGIGHNGLQLEQVAGEIAAAEPDVVLLQEVDKHRFRSRLLDEADTIAGLVGMKQVFATNVTRAPVRRGDPEGEYGTAVLTALPVESWTHTLLPNRPGRQQRGLQHLVVRLGNRSVSIYNTHLDHTTPSLRQAQMRKVRDIVAVDPLPAILGGDFNASPGSATLALALDPAHSDLEDPWPLVGDGDGLTVPNNAPRTRIDFLLVSHSWKPTVMATWRSAVSDHHGVVGRFVLPGPRTCR